MKEKSQGVFAILGTHNDICTTAIRYSNPRTFIERQINTIKSIFSDKVAIGIERSATENDSEYHSYHEHIKNELLMDLAESTNTPTFAMNFSMFVQENEVEAHKTKEAILLDVKLNDLDTTSEAMSGHDLTPWDKFTTRFKDLPLLANNAEQLWDYITKGVERAGVRMVLDKPVLPSFPIPSGQTPVEYMRELAEKGVKEHLEIRYKQLFNIESLEECTQQQNQQIDQERKQYQERLNFEIEIIDDMGFVGYFLIVSDFIIWAKENGVPVGDGRGSGAGSLVAYGLKITNINPIVHDLLFERFLNPERVSMPDFDIDFGSGFHPVTGEPMGRDDVIAYVADKYNDPKAEFPSVAQIATHGLMLGKSATKAVAKTMGMSLRFAEDLTAEYPEAPDAKMSETLEVPSVYAKQESESTTAELLQKVTMSEMRKKSSGVHAGGVVIADGDITQFVSVQSPSSDPSKLIAQPDKVDVERAGLVKFDFLGLANLTTISLAIHYIYRNRGIKLDLRDILLDDKDTYRLLQDGNTHGVFQVESAGMKDLLRRVKVENIEEHSALLALFRPGPLQSGMVDNFIDRKHGKEKVSFPDEKYQHECLQQILSPTYGIILYQEQVMQIAQTMAGYSLGGADLLRRAMGKKKPEEMAKQRNTFESGSVKNGIDGNLSMKIFDLVEKFAGYGFNKSHSMSYAYISFYTAWLKTHYPTEYMAAVLSGMMDKHDNLEVTIDDCKKNGITILPPDINISEEKFTPEGEGAIRFGLGAIHQVGSTSAKRIIEEREIDGSFADVFDIKVRCGSALDATTANALAESGALDNLPTRFDTVNPVDELGYSANQAPPQLSLSEQVALATAEQNECQRRFDSVTGYGKEISTIIDSLCIHYSKRYGLSIPDGLTQKERVGHLWNFFGQTLAEGTRNDLIALEADFDTLRREIAARNTGGAVYKMYLQELNEAKERVTNLKRLESLSESVVDEDSAVGDIEKKGCEPHMSRAYKLHEVSLLSSLKAADLKKNKWEIIYAALKPAHAYIASRIETTLDYLTTSIEKDAEALSCPEKLVNTAPCINNFHPRTREGIYNAVCELTSLNRITKTALKKTTSQIRDLLSSDESLLVQVGARLMQEETKELPTNERLKAEKMRLTMYTSGHPLDIGGAREKLKAWFRYTDLNNAQPSKIDPVTEKPYRESVYTIGGIVKSVREMQVKKEGKNFGRKMAAFILEDGNGTIRATAFPDAYESIKDYIYVGSPLWIKGSVAVDEYLGDGTLKVDIAMLGTPESKEPVYINSRNKRRGRHERDQETIAALADKLDNRTRANLIVMR